MARGSSAASAVSGRNEPMNQQRRWRGARQSANVKHIPAAYGESRHRAWVVGYGPLGCSFGCRRRRFEASREPPGGLLG
eukprot:5238274-Pyramimonas_sp.AAC.1